MKDIVRIQLETHTKLFLQLKNNQRQENNSFQIKNTILPQRSNKKKPPLEIPFYLIGDKSDSKESTHDEIPNQSSLKRFQSRGIR